MLKSLSRVHNALNRVTNNSKIRTLAKRSFDPFGTFKPIKRATVTLCAAGSVAQFFISNRLQVEGQHILKDLDPNNVLFVMNHETYFMDMIGFYWVVSSPNPFHKLPWIYFVADRKTMQRNFITREVFRFAGCIGIQRTWKEGEEHIKRSVDLNDQHSVGSALNDGWVVTFPQGTTRPFAPIRRGAAHIIRQYKPTVVPVVISGFGEAFGKASLVPRKKGVELKIRIKPPLELSYDEEVEVLQAKIAEVIEQSERFQPDEAE